MNGMKKWVRGAAWILSIVLFLQAVPVGLAEGWMGYNEDASGVLEAADRYTVRFILDGEAEDTLFVPVGMAIGTLPQAPERPGYAFLGWFDGAAAVGADLVPAGDMTLVGRYAPVSPVQTLSGEASFGTVTYFDLQGANLPGGAAVTAHAFEDTEILKKVKADKGVRILDQTLFGVSDPYWTESDRVRVTVTFRVPVVLKAGEELRLLDGDGREVTDASFIIRRGCLIKMTFTADPLGAFTLIGCYEDPTAVYTVAFMADGQEIEIRKVGYGRPVGAFPEAPAKADYIFSGWVSDRIADVNEGSPVYGDTVISAVYEPAFPAITAEGEANGVSVTVYAPRGALPASALFRVTAVEGEDYRAAVEEALGGRAGRIMAVDLSFTDENGAECQPLKPVTVQMTVTGMEGEEKLSVVHFAADGSAEVVYSGWPGVANTRGGSGRTFSFRAGGFSVYAITEGDETVTFRRTYNFEDINDSGTYVNYYFYNKNGESVHQQIAKTGDVLDEVPEPFHMGTVFLGWYVWENGAWGDEVTFTEAVPEVTADETVTVRARYQGVYYVNFHEFSEGHDPDVILTTKITDSDGNLRVDDVLAPQPDDSHIFNGWIKDGTVYPVYDENKQLKETTLAFTADSDLNPHFVEAHWLRFVSGGAQASYVPAQFVEADEIVTELPVPTRKGYTFGGWYYGTMDNEGNITYGQQVTGGDGSVVLSGGLTISEETTLYGNWIADDDATYTVVIWRQKVTDSKSAADSEKTYDFAESHVRTGSTGDAVTASAEDTGHSGGNYNHFHYARTVQNSETILANGSTVINVYYDRELMAVNFYYQNGHQPSDAQTAYTYTATTSNNGTQYGVNENGEYIQLVRDNGTTTTRVYYTYTAWWTTTPTEYTGTFYTRRGQTHTATQYNGNNLPPAGDNTTYYTEDLGLLLGHQQLTRRTQTTTEYHWTMNGEPYTGTRYTRSTMSGYPYMVTWTGLYGQSFEQNGYTWPANYSWNEQSNGRGTTQTFLTGFTQDENPYDLYDQGSTGSSVIYHYKQALDGRYYQTAGFRYTAYGSGGSFNFTNKFDGFTVHSYNTGNNGYSETGGSNTNMSSTPNTYPLHVYHERSEWSITYKSDGVVVHTENHVQYEQPLNGQANAAIHFTGGKDYSLSLADVGLSERDHYTFTGWYADDTCTTLYDFENGTMPNANVVVYAGWEKDWYEIIVDPDGGVINPSVGATYFWKQYEDTFDRYNISRNYIEDPNGAYKYVYVDGREDPDGNIPSAQRTATYVEAEDGYTGTRYRPIDPASDPTYSFVGWYLVDRDTGKTTSTPYDFDAEVEGPVWIRAVWRLDGDYGLVYDPTMKDGDTVIATGTFTQSSPDSRYADAAEFVIQQGPANITPQYVFDGWEIVDRGTGEVIDNNNGAYFQPGEKTTMKAGLWARNKLVTLRAHYTRVEESEDPVPVTKVIFDANGGKVHNVTSTNPADGHGKITVGQNRVEISGLHINEAVTTYGENEFYYADDDTWTTLLGWNHDKNAADAGTVEFECGQVIGADNLPDTANTLYAVWQKWGYLKLSKHFDIQSPYLDGDAAEAIWNTLALHITDADGNAVKVKADSAHQYCGIADADGNEGISLQDFYGVHQGHTHHYTYFVWLPVGTYTISEDQTEADNLLPGYTRVDAPYQIDNITVTPGEYGTTTNIGGGDAQTINNHYTGASDIAYLDIEKVLAEGAPAAASGKTYTFVVRNDTLSELSESDVYLAGNNLNEFRVGLAYAAKLTIKPGEKPKNGNNTLNDGGLLKVQAGVTYSIVELNTDQGATEDPEIPAYTWTASVSGLMTPTTANTTQNPAKITITNEYTRTLAPVTLRKTVSGNMASVDEEFDFTIHVYKEYKENPDDMEELNSPGLEAGGWKTSVTGLTGADIAATDLGYFPIGAYVEIIESSENAAGYTTTGKVNDETVDVNNKVIGFTVPAPGENQTAIPVVFNNDLRINIPTGIETDITPHVVVLGSVLMAAALWLTLRRRRITVREEGGSHE